MRSDIVAFVREICARFGLKAVFIPDAHSMNDVWSITTKSGIAIMNFTTKIFYDIPPRARMRMVLPTIKRGLNQAIGEKVLRETKHFESLRRMGRVIA